MGSTRKLENVRCLQGSHVVYAITKVGDCWGVEVLVFMIKVIGDLRFGCEEGGCFFEGNHYKEMGPDMTDS